MDKIICVGKNYLDHAQELGDVVPEKPVLFLKPQSVLKQAKAWGQTLSVDFPSHRGEVHFECELVFRIRQNGVNGSKLKSLNDAFDAVSVGLDMTLRDHQSILKKAGHPWTTAKVFSDSAIVGPWVPVNQWHESSDFCFSLNNQLKQKSKILHMRFHPCELLAYAAEFFPICKGDLLFTGTPAGVAPWKKGETGEVKVDEKSYFVSWH